MKKTKFENDNHQIQKQGKKRIIDLSQEEKEKKIKEETPALALKEMQEFLMKQFKDFKPKYKL